MRVEIKTDLSLGTMHLPPSRHRKYPYWNYKRDSTAEQIYVDVGLRRQPNRTLRTEQFEKTIDIILNTSKSYVEYARNDFIYGLSGYLFHNGISELSATSLIGRLCKQANDEEADARLDVLSETYKKGKKGKPIRGISQLKFEAGQIQ